MSKLLLALLLLCCGCSPIYSRVYAVRTEPIEPPRVIPVWVDTRFAPGHVREIDRAVEQWNWTLNGYVVLRVVDIEFNGELDKLKEQHELGGYLVRWTTSRAMAVRDDAGEETLGYADSVGGHNLWLVMDRVRRADVAGVTAHELGHLLGVDHGAGIMAAAYDRHGVLCVDKGTAAKAELALAQRAGAFNYCEVQ